ncbi:ion channel [Paenibacillus solani]|uniref:ion channel n=1 Tax=Paenibacillus solani TaxID=1705565 RepID=UPI003D2A9023
MFATCKWEEMSEEQREIICSMSEDALIKRWNTPQGKKIKQKIIEINYQYGTSNQYVELVGTIKEDMSAKSPKIDLRGIDFSNFYNLKNDEIFSFDFSNCSLKYSNFKNSKFMTSKFANADILYSHFEFTFIDYSDFSNSNLTLSNFDNCSFEHGDLCGAWISSVSFKDSNLGYVKFDRKTDFYNIDTDAFAGSTNPLFLDNIRRKHFLKNFKNHSVANKIVYYIWWVISDCGQSFFRWFGWSVIISIIFGALYSAFSDSFIITSGRDLTPFSFYYYSVVTFSTLGYGDISPANLLGEILVTLEVVIGYIMLGGLLSIFADKFIPKK